MSTSLPLRVDPDASIPLATQLTRQLSWLIASGAIANGDELPPAQVLADELGINFHTVRAAYQRLSGDGLISVSRGRRARVVGFDRTRAAASNLDAPSFSIGVIIPNFVPFYGLILDGIEEAAAAQSTMVVVANAREDPGRALDYLDRLVARGADGIIVAAALLPIDIPLPPVGRPPIVFIDSPGSPGPSVEFDLYKAQQLATRHLIEHGHSRIGYVTPRPELANVAQKLGGHHSALDEAGIEHDPDLVVTTAGFEMGSATAAIGRLLDLAEPPTAIAAASDSLAVGCYHALESRNIRVPDDVALTGNDGSEQGAIIRPALTSVEIPAREAGAIAVAMLNGDREAGSAKPLILDVRLTTRDSCGPH